VPSAKNWWLGFPRFKCPHCHKTIAGMKFVGSFRLPRLGKPAEAPAPEPNSRGE